MFIYCVVTYEYNTLSYDGTIEGERIYFKYKEDADNYCKRLYNSLDSQDKKYLAPYVDKIEVNTGYKQGFNF